MLVLKCIGGAILGAIGGAIATIVGGLAIWLVAGLIMWDSEKGRDAANAASGFFLGGIVIGVIWTIQVDARRRRERRRAAEGRRRAAEGRWNVRRNRLTDLVTSSRATFLSLDELVDSANSHLDRAEKEFKERAFAPFWDQVEDATNRLGAYHEGIRFLDDSARKYRSQSSDLKASVPMFDIPEGQLPDARPVAGRLSRVVRDGQKDYQFASIYEQRKTNQLLYAGFGTLAAGIAQMQSAIVGALDDLSVSLGSVLEELVSSSYAQAEAVSDLADSFSGSAEAQREYEEDSMKESKKQTGMLDNIQRGRKPYP